MNDVCVRCVGVDFPGHKDSVTSVGFSYDGKYVATGDMSGLVQVWTAESGKRVWWFETTDLEVSLLVGYYNNNALCFYLLNQCVVQVVVAQGIPKLLCKFLFTLATVVFISGVPNH